MTTIVPPIYPRHLPLRGGGIEAHGERLSPAPLVRLGADVSSVGSGGPIVFLHRAIERLVKKRERPYLGTAGISGPSRAAAIPISRSHRRNERHRQDVGRSGIMPRLAQAPPNLRIR